MRPSFPLRSKPAGYSWSLKEKITMAMHTYVDLEIEEARYLANLAGIEYDLRTTIEWCNQFDQLMADRDKFWLVEPMTTAILIRFTRALGDGKRYPDTKHILSVLSKEEKKQYEFFKNVRSKHVAHSVNEFEDNQVRAYYIKGAAVKGVNSIGLGCNRMVGLSSDEINNICNICQSLMAKVNSEMESEKKKLLKLISKYTEENILKFKMKVPKHPKEIDVSKDRK